MKTMDSINLDLPSSYDISDLQLDSAKRRLDLSLNQPTLSKSAENYLTIKIPTSLLTEVYKVTGDNPVHESAGSSRNGTALPSLEIDFTVEESSDEYTSIKIPLQNEMTQRILIIGV